MTAKDFKVALLPKLDGTKNLHEAVNGSNLDFFVMLSSLTNIIGLKGQANYAAGNGFQDYLVNSQTDAGTQYISLNLGMIEDSEVITLHPKRVPGLIRAGCLPFKVKQFLALLEYSLSSQGRYDKCKQVVIGVDRQSISEQEDLYTLRNPMFSHLPYAPESQMRLGTSPQASKDIDKLLTAAEGIGEVHSIISAGIAKKIAALMALDAGEINLETPIADLGINSLVAIELKNWIGRTLQAAMQTFEILDTPNISALTVTVAKRSTLVVSENHSHPHSDNRNKVEASVEENLNSLDTPLHPSARLPSLPLPDLESTLQLYLTAVRSFCSREEIEEIEKAIQEFLDLGNIGRQLQNRLLQRASDPSVDDWQSDLYNAHVYLKCRAPINTFQHFGGCFMTDTVQHGQAEQAAIISLAAFQFKQRLEACKLDPDFLNEQPLCMSSLEWIFNTSREPRIGVDRVQKFAKNDFLVVLRRGHIFKVTLKGERGNVPYTTLKMAFQEILGRASSNKASVASLTADERDSWTKVLISF